MTAEIRADLIVSGSPPFDPEDLQRECGLAADIIWHVGDLIGPSCRRRDCNAWVLSTGYLEDCSLSECLSQLMKKADTGWDRLRTVCAREGVEAEFGIALYVTDWAPEMHCSSEIVRRMAELGANLDIDLILLGEDDDGEPQSPGGAP